MTGRGRPNQPHYRPHPDAKVIIGVSVSVAPPFLDLNSTTPFFIVTSARILRSPLPHSAVSISDWHNPLSGPHMNRAWKNPRCVHPEGSTGKRLDMVRSHLRVHYAYVRNLRESGIDFITIRPGETVEIGHELRREDIEDGGFLPGERYRIAISELGLGTNWWMFGAMEDIEGYKIRRWQSEKTLEHEKEEVEEMMRDDPKYDAAEDEYGYGMFSVGKWTMGEYPQDLGMVIENGEVDFEVVDSSTDHDFQDDAPLAMEED